MTISVLVMKESPLWAADKFIKTLPVKSSLIVAIENIDLKLKSEAVL